MSMLKLVYCLGALKIHICPKEWATRPQRLGRRHDDTSIEQSTTPEGFYRDSE